jgi:acyl homoserine lactone synthase
MIRIVDGMSYAQNAAELDQMFRLRKRVFHDRLKWEVNVSGEYEIDSYDFLRPLYVLAMDDSSKQVLGSLRLLPSTGPNMLNDTFSALLPEGKPYQSPTVWESSRYCVDTEASEKWCEKGVHQTSAELLLALYEIGMTAGLDFVVSVVDLRMERIFRRLNSSSERIGGPVKFGEVSTVAALWETTPEALERVRAATGIFTSVLEAQDPPSLKMRA